MRFSALVIIALVAVYASAATNTTEFWRQQLNFSAADMHFQCFSGKLGLRQAIRTSIGTERTVECTTSFTVLWGGISDNLLRKCLSSYGCRADLEAALCLVPSRRMGQSESLKENRNCFNTHGTSSDTCFSSISL